MGYDLDGTAAEITAPLLLDNGPVDLAGGDIGVFFQVFIDKTFIVPQIEVGLDAVLGDEDFAVLDRVHGSRVHIDVGVELLHGNGITAGLEETSQRSGGDTFAESGDDAAQNKNIFCTHRLPP